jgi:hypothetical protein
VYVGPDGERNPRGTFEDKAAAIERAESLAAAAGGDDTDEQSEANIPNTGTLASEQERGDKYRGPADETGEGGEAGDVIETQDQQQLTGDVVPQTKLAGGEEGERGQGEVADPESGPDGNPGGLMADERDLEDEPDDSPTGADTTQGGLETFDTGGRRDAAQGGLGSFSGSDGDEIETFQDAINAIDDEIETYGQRIPFDSNIMQYLDSQGLDQTVWTESLSQDIARYGIDAVDAERRLREAIEEHEEKGLLDGPADVDLYRQAITDYARSEL